MNVYVDSDFIFWDPVETADVYTVSIDDDYTYETRQSKCLNSNVINYSGTIKIKIKANAYGEYGESDWSEVYEYNYIAKTVDYETVQRLMNLSIGRGYNLYEHDYLDLANYASTKSVLDISKLLSIGTFRNPQNSSATGSAINYSSIDEFLTKTAVNIEYASEKSTQLLGSLKKTFSFDANVDYRKYEEKNTLSYIYDVTYRDFVIDDFSGVDAIAGCLSKSFLEDIRRQSNATRYMNEQQLIEYIYNYYGTHAILGVTTGGRYRAFYTISTNDENLAIGVKAAFSRAVGGELFNAIIQTTTGLNISLSETLSWHNSETYASFYNYYYGGEGGLATSPSDVSNAIQYWSKSIKEENAIPVRLTRGGAVSISTLLYFVDANLAKKYEDYVNQKADTIYQSILDMYATFDRYAVNVISSQGGTYEIKNPKDKYEAGDEIELVAKPSPNYYFAGWFEDGELLSKELNYKHTVVKNTTIEARFDVNPVVYKPFANVIEMTFTADLYCESTKIDTITFNVIGQLVKYEGKEYVMGTAYYTGNLRGKRFNDVANVHLRNSNKYILYGGILHWFGTYDDNNESGIAVHNGIPGYDVTYMPKNPRDDLAGNEYQIISITGIIVSTGNNASDSVRYPELGKTQFKANLYCEGTDVGYVTFDVLGVKVELNGAEYLYGFAVYNGTPGGKRFNDVDKIKLYNPTKEIKSGGHLYWRGSYDDTNETGMAIYNKTYSNYVEYISENPTNDFAANTNNFVIITGIVFKTGNKTNGEYIPKLVNTSLDATLYCESLYIKRIKLDIIGFETLDGHIIGNASYTGNPGSSRFNDVGNIKLLDPSISIRYGGTLGWCGTINDNNESGVAGWDASDKSRIIYMSDTPYNDMACNEELNLRISFFCLKKSN